MFVGGFAPPPDGTVGGQLFACNSLLASPLAQLVKWQLIDSSQNSNPAPSLWRRCLMAARRLTKFTIGVFRCDSALIFTSFEPFSLLEKGLMCFIARAVGCNVVLSIRSHPVPYRRFSLFLTIYARVTCACSSKIICQSFLALIDLRRNFQVSEDKAIVIENWIDSDTFSPADHPKSDFTHRIATSEVKLLFVGGLQPLKGVGVLIESIAAVRRSGSSIRLEIVGRGPEEARLTSQVKELGLEDAVTFSGWVPNDLVPEKMRSSDVFVLPSFQEGMPNAVLQAMACGLPIVATAISSIPALVEDGVNGFLVPPGDMDALAAAVSRLALDRPLRERMGVENRRKVLEEHTISLVWPRVAAVLAVDVRI